MLEIIAAEDQLKSVVTETRNYASGNSYTVEEARVPPALSCHLSALVASYIEKRDDISAEDFRLLSKEHY